MAKRFHSGFISDLGVEYDVEVWDSSFGGASTAFTLDGRGFQLSYEGSTSEIYSPLMPSSCTFSMQIESANETAINTFITDLLTANEKRFQVKITTGASPSIHWFGNILNDISRQQDTSPSYFEVQAVCGIGALKDVDYNNAGIAYTGTATLMQHIVTALGKIGTLDTFFTAGTAAITTISNWYEDSHTTGSAEDLLTKTRLKHAAFFKIDDNGVYTYQSAYDVLKYIAQRFGYVIKISDGRFRIEQISERDNTTIRERYYDKDGAYLSNTTINHNITLNQTTLARLTNGTFDWYPALREVTETYNHRTRTNHLAGASWSNASAPLFTGNFDINVAGNTTLQLSGIHSRTLSILTGYVDGSNIVGVWGLTLSVGSYYLKRDIAQILNGNITYTSTEWVNYPSQYKIVYNYAAYNFPAIGQSVTLPGTIPLTTPGLPAGGAITAKIEYLNHRKLSNGNIVDNTTISVTWSFSNMNLQVYTNGNPNDISDKTQYKATGPATGNTSKLDFENILGDGVDTNSVGKLEVQDSGGFWTDSSQWRVGTSGSYLGLSDLFLREILGLQKTNTRRYSGTLRGATIKAHSKISFDGNGWMMTRATYSANTDEWTGTWFAISRDITFLTNQSPSHIIPAQGHLPTIIQSTPIMVPPNTSAAVGNALSSATVKTAITSGGPVTSVAVNETLAANAFSAGDILAIVNTQTGATMNLTVTADVTAGATSVSVFGYATDDFPEGSPIIYLPQNVTIQGGGSGSTSTAPLSLGDLLEWFGQLTQLDETLSLDWPLQVNDIVIETNAAAGDGLTAGLRFDTTGIQLYISTSTTPVAKLLPDGTWELRTHPNAGNGSTAGIVISKSGGVLVYGATSVTPQAGFGVAGSFLARVDFLIETSENAGNGSTAGIRWDTTNGFKAYKNALGGSTPTVSIPVAGTWEFRTNGNTGSTASGVILGSDSGILAFKSTSTTPTFHLKHTGQLTFNHNGHPTVEAGIFYVNNGLIWLDQDGSGSKVHPQYGHLRNFNIIGLLTNWTTGWKDVFWRVTSEYAGLEIYRIGYSVGDTAGSGSGSNVALVKHQNAAGTVTTTVGTMTCDTTGIANIVTASNLITLAQGDLIYFEVSTIKSTPAKGLIADLYFRKA